MRTRVGFVRSGGPAAILLGLCQFFYVYSDLYARPKLVSPGFPFMGIGPSPCTASSRFATIIPYVITADRYRLDSLPFRVIRTRSPVR